MRYEVWPRCSAGRRVTTTFLGSILSLGSASEAEVAVSDPMTGVETVVDTLSSISDPVVELGVAAADDWLLSSTEGSTLALLLI